MKTNWNSLTTENNLLEMKWNTQKKNHASHSKEIICLFKNSITLPYNLCFCFSYSRYGGRTNTQAALQTMNDDVFVTGGGDRNGIDNIAIVVTDGGSNILREETIPEANRARSFG